MGLISEYRERGLGSRLLSAVIDHSKSFGLEKIELSVYTSNKSAIALYKKFRKLDGQYFDCLAMGKFL